MSFRVLATCAFFQPGFGNLTPGDREPMAQWARTSYETQMSVRAGVDVLEEMFVEAWGR